MTTANYKPLGRKAYTSIGHLPGSRVGVGDHTICHGQAVICKKARHNDTIIVQEKIDGSCVAVARLGEQVLALGRAGWPCHSSPHFQHQMFHIWTCYHADRFREVLRPGERLVGEWCAQPHGTKYNFAGREPFFAFDIMTEDKRLRFRDFQRRVKGVFNMPPKLYEQHGRGAGLVPDAAYAMTKETLPGIRIGPAEGVVYRVETDGEYNFIGKWVRWDYVAGLYFPERGAQPIWNWTLDDLTKPVAVLE